jgi:hypothetical protein
MSQLLPIVIALHVALAVALFLPSIMLPFALRARRPVSESGNRVVRGLMWLQTHGTIWVGAGLAATGLTLIAILGPSLLGQAWLLVALAIYAANLAVVFFIQRPSLLRLVGVRAPDDDAVWRSRARRQRYLSYAMAGLVGTIGFLMSTKPTLW